MDLSVILKSVIPDNIKRIPLVQVCADAFAEMLSRNSTISARIYKLFDVNDSVFYRRDESDVLIPDDPLENLEKELEEEQKEITKDETKIDLLEKEISYRKYVKECRNNLKKGLFYTFLAVVFSRMEILSRDPVVQRSLFQKSGNREYLNSKLLENPYDLANSEFLGAFRYFQQCSGTENAIRYIYQFSRYLETGQADNSLDLETGDPFFLEYVGELHKSVFSVFNQPMAHPCGWCFQYTTVASQGITDYYGKITYSVGKIILNWKSKKIYIGELPEGVEKTNNVVWERAISTVEQKLLNNDKVHVISDRTPRPDGQHIHVVDLKVKTIEEENSNILITFENSERALIIDRTAGYEVRFGYRSKIYNPENCYIFPKNTRLDAETFSPTKEFKTLYIDQMAIEDTLEPSADSKAVEYNDDYSKAFRLVGDSYPYCPGVDESRHRVTNNTNVYSKFTLTVNYRSINLTYLKIEDDFGHSYAVTRDQTTTKKAGNQFKVNTHGYRGEYLTFRAYDGMSFNYDHYIRMNLLNNTSGTVRVSEFSIENKRLTFRIKSTIFSSLYTKVTIGSSVIERRTGFSALINIDTSSYPMFSEFQIESSDGNDTLRISGNGLNNEAYNFWFSFPEYGEGEVVKPVFVNCTPDSMSPTPSGKTLGKLNETPTLKFKNNTIQEDPTWKHPDGIGYVSEYNPKNHKGCVYINRGYTKEKSKSLDNMNTACTKYIEDEFWCETSGSNTWLEFDNPVVDGSLGKYLVCMFNNDPQTDVTRGFLRGNFLVFQ